MNLKGDSIDARDEDPAEVLRKHGGADVAVGLAVDDRSFATAYSGLRRGGRLVLVAASPVTKIAS